MLNTFAYLLQDGNAVVATQLDEYFKKFLDNYVYGKLKGSEFVSVDLVGSEIYLTYKPQAEDCGDCYDNGITVGLCECAEPWLEQIDYTTLEVFGTL